MPPTILLIDQSEDDYTKLHRYLTDQAGFARIVHAVSASEGIALARHLQPDCILIELKQSDMVGMEALQLLKAETPGRPVPIIIWTRLNSDMLRAGAAMLGVQRYFTKSTGSEALVGDAIIALLKERGETADEPRDE